MKPRILLVFSHRFADSSAMLGGVAQFARLHHPWSFFLDDEVRAETDPAWLRGGKWDGVISRHATPAFAQACAQLKIPLVDLNDSESIAGAPKVRPDNAAIGRAGAEHFIGRGFHTLAFCGCGDAAWSRERRDGFAGAARLAKRECETLDVDCPGDSAPAPDARQASALAKWLRRLAKPAAIMACCDAQALRVAAAAREAGLHVPEVVAVLGVGNNAPCCELGDPPLSSVDTSAFQSGYLAAGCLAGLLSGVAPKAGGILVKPAGVVTRRSTDVVAIDDRIMADALHCIRERACLGLTVGQIIGQVGVSRSVLEKKFRTHLKHSPQAEIRRAQVEKIRQLLRETDFPLKKIAALTGFGHVEYMNVVFKRFSGQTPGTYRKKNGARGGQ